VKKWGFLAMIAILAAASVSAANLDFFSLVENGPPQAVQSAIDAGANVNASNKYSETPLMDAAVSNADPGVVTALLEAGADAKTVNDAGDTAFAYARHNGNLEGTNALKQLAAASQ
jgi:uncharacterized protein